ncbi:MAG: hypothetical protein ACREGB_04685, partial [Candidatus Saccharimonadales bacterium]
IRKHKIAVILTAHLRAELDQREQMRGNTVKMGLAWASKHWAEFFIFIEPNLSKEGRTDLAGEKFEDAETKDFMDNALKTGHKIRFKVTGNSLGPAGRCGEFTLDYHKGITNQYEEIFTLGKNLGIITKPNNLMYSYKDMSWKGLPNCLIFLRDNPEVCQQILAEVYAKDMKVGV